MVLRYKFADTIGARENVNRLKQKVEKKYTTVQSTDFAPRLIV